MKIAIIADIHIGKLPNIERYYNEELVWFINKIREIKADLIVVAGDLFDKRITKDSLFDHYSNLFVSELANIGCDVTLIRGTLSHDYNQLNSFIFMTKSKPNVRIFNTVQDFNIGKCKFLMIPEEYEYDKEKFYKDTVFNPEKKYDFVFGHGSFDFAGMSIRDIKKNRIVFSSNDFVDNVYGKVIFGHIHIKCEKKNCKYVGSFSRYNFGEEEDKGFLFYDYNENTKKITKEEFIINEKAPTFKTINSDELPEKDSPIVINKLADEYNYLRIITNGDISREKMLDIKSAIYNRNNIVYERRQSIYENKNEKETKDEEEKRKQKKAELEKYREMDLITLTKTMVKEKYGIEVTTEEIKEAIK